MVIKTDEGWLGRDGFYATAEEAHESFWKYRSEAYRKGIQFEKQVGDLFGKLGAKRIIHNAAIDGSQIDLVIEQELPSGLLIKSIVECKAWSRPIGVKEVNAFSVIFRNLHSEKKAADAIIVSLNGFTPQAKQAAESYKIRLFDVNELKRLSEQSTLIKKDIKIIENIHTDPSVFVVMPFDEKFDDIYYFGIRGAVEDANMICERADEIIHSGGIIELIEEKICEADIIVADMTDQDPNVFYEVGIAHIMKKPVALLVQNVKDIPFDLRNKNHIVYGGKIKLLREKLCKLLEKMKEDFIKNK